MIIGLIIKPEPISVKFSTGRADSFSRNPAGWAAEQFDLKNSCR